MDSHTCRFCQENEIESGEHYCHYCGRLDAWLVEEDIQREYSVATQGQTVETLVLRNGGFAELEGSVSLQTPEEVCWIHFGIGGQAQEEYRFSLGTANNPKRIPLVFEADQLPDGTRKAGQTQFSLAFDVKTGSPETAEQFRDAQIEERSRIVVGPVRVFLRERGQLGVLPELLLFSEKRRQRSLTLRNVGGSRLTLTEVKLPSGILVVYDGNQDRGQGLMGTEFSPGKSREIAIKLGDNVEVPNVPLQVTFITDPESTAVATLARDLRAPVFRGTTERFHVCVDFGTSKTVVGYTDGLSEDPNVQLVPLENERVEIPSEVMYVGRGGERRPEVGWRAHGEYDETTMARVRAIKTQLRKNMIVVTDPEAPSEGETATEFVVTSVQVLEPLLTHVERSIHSHFVDKHLDNVYGDTTRFIFSLPVLDAETATEGVQDSALRESSEDSKTASQTQAESVRALYDRQRQVTLEAARRSGFHPEQRLSTRLEPWCVAAYALWEKGMRFQPDDLVCIYDFGAGSLDVSVLRVKSESELEELLSIGRFLSHSERERLGRNVELGGDVLDMWLRGYILSKMMQETGEDEAPLLEPVDYEVEMAVADGDTVLVPIRAYRITGEDSLIEENALLDDIREAKESLYDPKDPAEAFRLTRVDYALTRSEVNRVLERWIPRSFETIRTRCEAAGICVPFDHIVLSGGSSLIPLVQERARTIANNVIAPKDREEAVYAVVRGGPHLHQIRFTRPSPYEIWAEHAQTGTRLLVCDERMGWPREFATDLLENIEGTWSLRMNYESREYVLAHFNLEENREQLLFAISEDGRISLRRALAPAKTNTSPTYSEPDILVEL